MSMHSEEDSLLVFLNFPSYLVLKYSGMSQNLRCRSVPLTCQYWAKIKIGLVCVGNHCYAKVYQSITNVCELNSQ